MSGQLFRKEALQQERQPLEGSLLMAASPRTTILAMVSFLIAVCTVLYFCLGEFDRKAKVQGYLAPDKGLIKVFPQVTGTLLERRVEEGAFVEKGQILAVVSTEHGSLQVRDANAEAIRFLQQQLSSLTVELESQRQIGALREAAVKTQLTSLDAELLQLDAAVSTFKSRLYKSQQENKRFEDLEMSGFVASSDVHLQRDRTLELRGRLQVLQRDRVALDGRKSALNTDIISGKLDSQLQQEALKRRISELQQQRSEYLTKSEAVVAAPADGIVTTILIQPGQQTRRDAPLLSIIPQGATLEAVLLVPSRAIGFIAAGQTVALRYAAFPYQRFGHYRGEVQSISRTLLLPGDADLPTPLTTPAYLVSVALETQSVSAYQKDFALQAGMSFEGDVRLDRRSIIQWMFDPLFSLTKRS